MPCMSNVRGSEKSTLGAAGNGTGWLQGWGCAGPRAAMLLLLPWCGSSGDTLHFCIVCQSGVLTTVLVLHPVCYCCCRWPSRRVNLWLMCCRRMPLSQRSGLSSSTASRSPSSEHGSLKLLHGISSPTGSVFWLHLSGQGLPAPHQCRIPPYGLCQMHLACAFPAGEAHTL